LQEILERTPGAVGQRIEGEKVIKDRSTTNGIKNKGEETRQTGERAEEVAARGAAHKIQRKRARLFCPAAELKKGKSYAAFPSKRGTRDL